ncbi:MAG: hypothetical protein JO283_19805 [Bradyrhizobium sp.]|nr:hypothetical protein [Bradyrhizobium sp.]
MELYPPLFLQRHRAEMLQNFADLEDATDSKAKLWLLIGKDLAVSFMSQFFESRLGHYVIAVVVTWILIFAIGYVFHRPIPAHPALHAFLGFLPGMLAMYVVTRLYGRAQNGTLHFFRSRFDIYVIGVFVAWIVLFVIGYYFYDPTRGHPALQVFGGFLLGMVAMYIATHVYGMP